jgi:alkylhydroperoxidase family enzyme
MRALRVIQQRIERRVRGVVAAEPDVVAAVGHGHRALDAVVARALAQAPSACSAGCSYCCHVHVDTTRAEVLAEVRTTAEKSAAMNDE